MRSFSLVSVFTLGIYLYVDIKLYITVINRAVSNWNCCGAVNYVMSILVLVFPTNSKECNYTIHMKLTGGTFWIAGRNNICTISKTWPVTNVNLMT